MEILVGMPLDYKDCSFFCSQPVSKLFPMKLYVFSECGCVQHHGFFTKFRIGLKYSAAVLLCRVEKVVYSPDWKDGKPTAANKGISHCFKYMTLESYEDALNNIELEDKSAGLLEGMKDEYLLSYMLDLESRGSLIKTDDFRHPFDYTLKIAVDSSGASEKRKVDLVETFNYLIGLKGDQYVRAEEKGYAYVDGRNPKGEHVLVFWRDTEKIPNAELNKELEKLGVNPANKEFDLVYVNGDHGVANVTLDGKDEVKVLKIKQLENEFLDKMFEER